jgi:hypothetical protein
VCLLAGAGTLRAAEGDYAVAVTGIAHFNNLQFAAEGDRHVKLLPAAEARRQSRLTAP